MDKGWNKQIIDEINNAIMNTQARADYLDENQWHESFINSTSHWDSTTTKWTDVKWVQYKPYARMADILIFFCLSN